MSAALVLLIAGILIATFLFFPRPVSAWLARLSPEVTYFVPTASPMVALTIDDGPNAQETSRILDVLRAHGAQATFFLIGAHIPGNEALLTHMTAEGHELANHTLYDHMSVLVPPKALAVELAITHKRLIPFGPVRWLRPGSGFYSPAILRLARQYGYGLALGDVFPLDTTLLSSRFHAWYVLQNAKPGSIIILHDGNGCGLRTAETLEVVLPVLAARGFRVVSLSELAAQGQAGH